jgi:hypothetical protein
MAARAAASSLPAHVHVYFHDTDLLDSRRRVALRAGLALLGRRRRPLDLDQLAADLADAAPERDFAPISQTRS